MSEDLHAVVHDLTIYCYKEFSFLKQELEKMKEKSVCDNDQKISRKELDDHKSTCQTLFNSQKSELSRLSNELEKHRGLCKDYHEMLDKFFGENEKNKNDLQELTKKISDLRTEFKKIVSESQTWAVDLVDRRISDIKVLTNTKACNQDLEVLKNEVISKLEFVTLNGTNSTLRSQNADQQIKILEKKIENIYLILKKHELSVV
jgi:K+/H+ antiporter YhaU regulatory subunit KhtT